MKEPIRISLVNYLNSIPFRYGLEQACIENEITLSLDIPSTCATKLKTNEADIGLIPVAMIPHIENAQIISDYCIGANGPVKTVSLYSNSPIEELKTIYLDGHSRTSVALAKILALKKWNINPSWIAAEENFELSIPELAGGVVIGDKTFKLENKYTYNYDLSQEWHAMTGLPFVFAAWVSNKPLTDPFIEKFNASLSMGIRMINKAIQNYKSAFPEISETTMHSYLNNTIDYNFNTQKKEALALFLTLLEHPEISLNNY